MKARMEHFPAKKPNPVLSVKKDGTVLYSNEASEPLLNEWDVTVGDKLPSSIRNLVQRVFSRNNPEKMEVKVGKKIYLVVFHPLLEQECVNISGFDISDQTKLEVELQESEAPEMPNLELSEIIDAHAIQSLIDDFYELTHIPMSVDDCRGNVLVGVGWQDICTKFHRINPETCKHCAESSTTLSEGVLHGEFKRYKCKNNMWHITTPIMVGGQHVGNIISGQFFFEDEPLDYELFHTMARKYGFNEEEYMAALKKVPRLSRKAVDTGMSFFVKLANLISQLSYSNTRLAHLLSERNALLEALSKSEEKFRTLFENASAAIFVADIATGEIIDCNHNAEKLIGRPQMDILGLHQTRLHPADKDQHYRKMFANHLHDTVIKNYEAEVQHSDGRVIPVIINAAPLKINGRNMMIGFFLDITERKQAEEALKKAHVNLEIKVKERTAELESAYRSLKESEERLAEAQKMAHIGSYDWNIATNEEHWSVELYRIFGLDSHFELSHSSFLNRIHPEDFEYVNHAINEALNGKSYNIDYRIILPDGAERVIYSHGGVIFDEKNTPIRMRGIVQDITERKKAEESLERIEIARKKEIHHRIKNNLQVISSLLDLQAEKFDNRKNIEDYEVKEAFRESQDRVISMALIHEELHKGEGFEKLNFSSYIKELADNLFVTYRLGNKNINLNMDLCENILFDIDIAIPLGIIINELVSNSLKYAFPEKNNGEIRIKLCREEGSNTSFILNVSDNGVGITEDLDIENLNTLGLQLVTSLVDQLDGELELKRDNWTEFTIRFTVTEKDNQVLMEC